MWIITSWYYEWLGRQLYIPLYTAGILNRVRTTFAKCHSTWLPRYSIEDPNSCPAELWNGVVSRFSLLSGFGRTTRTDIHLSGRIEANMTGQDMDATFDLPFFFIQISIFVVIGDKLPNLAFDGSIFSVSFPNLGNSPTVRRMKPSFWKVVPLKIYSIASKPKLNDKQHRRDASMSLPTIEIPLACHNAFICCSMHCEKLGIHGGCDRILISNPEWSCLPLLLKCNFNIFMQARFSSPYARRLYRPGELWLIYFSNPNRSDV